MKYLYIAKNIFQANKVHFKPPFHTQIKFIWISGLAKKLILCVLTDVMHLITWSEPHAQKIKKIYLGIRHPTAWFNLKKKIFYIYFIILAVFCPFLKTSFCNPFLKVLDLSKLFVGDAPMKKKSRNLFLPPYRALCVKGR